MRLVAGLPLLVSAGADGTVRWWGPGTGDQVGAVAVPGGGVNAMDVDPSGRLVAVATPADATYLVPCEICVDRDTLLGLARRHSTRALTPEEDRRFAVTPG